MESSSPELRLKQALNPSHCPHQPRHKQHPHPNPPHHRHPPRRIKLEPRADRLVRDVLPLILCPDAGRHLLYHGVVVRRVVKVSRGDLAPEVAAVGDLDAARRAAGRHGLLGGADAWADHDVDVLRDGQGGDGRDARGAEGAGDVSFHCVRVRGGRRVRLCVRVCLGGGEPSRRMEMEDRGRDWGSNTTARRIAKKKYEERMRLQVPIVDQEIESRKVSTH